jgi:hypothetical protein
MERPYSFDTKIQDLRGSDKVIMTRYINAKNVFDLWWKFFPEDTEADIYKLEPNPNWIALTFLVNKIPEKTLADLIIQAQEVNNPYLVWYIGYLTGMVPKESDLLEKFIEEHRPKETYPLPEFIGEKKIDELKGLAIVRLWKAIEKGDIDTNQQLIWAVGIDDLNAEVFPNSYVQKFSEKLQTKYISIQRLYDASIAVGHNAVRTFLEGLKESDLKPMGSRGKSSNGVSRTKIMVLV